MATDAKTGEGIFGRYSAGIHNVGSYQSSGWPFITGSNIPDKAERNIKFPMVTKSLTLIASGTFSAGECLRLHFATTGTAADTATGGTVIRGHHYITLDSHQDSVTLNVKCKECFVTAQGGDNGFELYAELTNIPTSSMFALTGAGVTEYPGGYWGY